MWLPKNRALQWQVPREQVPDEQEADQTMVVPCDEIGGPCDPAEVESALAIWNSFRGSWAPLTYPHCVCAHVTACMHVCVIIFWCYEVLFSYIYNASALESTTSPRKLDSFYGECY